MAEFKDHFSPQAGSYAKFRPSYPNELYAWLAEQVAQKDHAWDCATGSGQAAVALAQYFDQITATDASDSQLKNALAHPKVTYRTAPAEASGHADHSVDLVTVAQALHWFHFERFYAEDCVMQEPGVDPHVGKATNRDREQKFVDSVKEFHGAEIKAHAASGDTSFSEWTMDITFQDGNRALLEQVTVRRWKDGQVVHERFYYNAG